LSKIKILSEHLANQIAAGEVIERPASVVKELLENSIDAGAGYIQLEVEGNGTRLIKVIDDGMGMDGDDIILCLERHATSKLGESVDDSSRLTAIRSLGFRGEAIPSIASVAKMSITSRTDKDTLGTRVDVRYGKIVKIHETGCNKGTVIEVRDLFGNMPARKKFLKSIRTELFHIEEIIKNYCLANPHLGITYSVNSKTVLDLVPNADTLEARVKKIFARNSSLPLIPVAAPGVSSAGGDIAIKGFLLSPEQSFAISARTRFFVNGRTVKDRMMAHALTEGLSGYLMKGRSPAGVLFVSVPYDQVDVNVHPAKQEIRFQQPEAIHRQIVTAVKTAMAAYQTESRQVLFGSGLNNKKSEPEQTIILKDDKTPPKNVYKLWKREATAAFQMENRKEPLSSGKTQAASSPETPRILATAERNASFHHKGIPQDIVPESLIPIGQLMDLYLLCEARQGDTRYLVVIDQHAVHERILYENLKKQFEARQMSGQNLLFPKMLELSPESAEILELNREEIRQLGLVVEEFGGDSYVIKAVPAVISHLDPEEILTGILAQFSEREYSLTEGKRRSDATRLEDILSSMACKAAIKAGQNLSDQEMVQLLKLMQKSRAFTHCPHGRPVVQLFSADDIKKWFHRT
jgi:DNA mismatch repair protein MutL